MCRRDALLLSFVPKKDSAVPYPFYPTLPYPTRRPPPDADARCLPRYVASNVAPLMSGTNATNRASSEQPTTLGATMGDGSEI